ncbi:MAG: helix-turn-helix domain-containing protein [Gammaproteobacteria bacterium]|nr:helix-turn-helix domain-containing protein [Gammaproteobacteria bacterium]
MITNEELHVEAQPRQRKQAVQIGATLKAARERLQLSDKEVAARLHLKPKIITNIESEQFDKGLPSIFLRGYLRSYAKLLNFSDDQINQLLSELEISNPSTETPTVKTPLPTINYDTNYANWATLLIIFLVISMVGLWWKGHTQPITNESEKPSVHITETKPASLPVPAIPTAVNTEAAVTKPIPTPLIVVHPKQTVQPAQSKPVTALPLNGTNALGETNTQPEPILTQTLTDEKANASSAVKQHRASSKTHLRKMQMDLPEPSLESDN